MHCDSQKTQAYLLGNLRAKSLPIVWSAENLIEFKAAEHYHQEVVWIHHGHTCLFFKYLRDRKRGRSKEGSKW